MLLKKIKLFSLIIVVSVELYVFSYEVCLYFVRFCVFCHDLYFEISTSALSQQYCAQALADCGKALLVWYLEEASMGQVPGAGMLDVQVSSQGMLWLLPGGIDVEDTELVSWEKRRVLVPEPRLRYNARMSIFVQCFCITILMPLWQVGVFCSISKLSYLLLLERENCDKLSCENGQQPFNASICFWFVFKEWFFFFRICSYM